MVFCVRRGLGFGVEVAGGVDLLGGLRLQMSQSMRMPLMVCTTLLLSEVK